MTKNDELTGKDLQFDIKAAFGEDFSVSKVKELHKKLGWLAEKTRCCQLPGKLIGKNNLISHKNASLAMISLTMLFGWMNVTYSSIGMVWWEPCLQKGKPKHLFKVCVWAAISKWGGCLAHFNVRRDNGKNILL